MQQNCIMQQNRLIWSCTPTTGNIYVNKHIVSLIKIELEGTFISAQLGERGRESRCEKPSILKPPGLLKGIASDCFAFEMTLKPQKHCLCNTLRNQRRGQAITFGCAMRTLAGNWLSTRWAEITLYSYVVMKAECS